jgi:pimeloyl-[acyl-carrier protein] methyl ester esterase
MSLKSLVAGAALVALLLPVSASLAQSVPVPAAVAAPLAPAATDTRPLLYGRFTVEVVGSGPDVILIPGLGSSRDTFRGLVEADRGRHRLHLIQIAGFAGTPAGDNASGDTVAAPTVEAIARYIADRGLKRPAVIGHSLGGESALMLAARHPGLVSRVMVVDAYPFLGLLFGKDETPATIGPRLAPWRDGMIKSDEAGWRQSSQGQSQSLVTAPERQREVTSWMLASDHGVVGRAFYELGTVDLRPELPKIGVPVTVLFALNSYIPMKPEQMQANVEAMYADLKGVKVVRVDDSRHFIMFDQPERFAAEVEGFLDGK